MRSQPNSPGFEVALGSHWGGFGVPIGWLSVGFEVALGWLWTPEYMPSICLLYGFAVALGGFAPPFEIGCWMFDVRCSMFENQPSNSFLAAPAGLLQSGLITPKTAKHPRPAPSGQEELAVLWLRRSRPAQRRDLYAHRELPAAQRRTLHLSQRRA